MAGYDFVRDFDPQAWKKNKKEFVEFVKDVNAKKESYAFDEREKEALKKLHDFWKSASCTILPCGFKAAMDLNEILDKRLGYDGEENEKWLAYSDGFMLWSGRFLMYGLMKHLEGQGIS